jgi:TatD DNase family protein
VLTPRRTPSPAAGALAGTDAALPAPGAYDSHSHMDIMGLPVDGVLAAARAMGIGRVVNVGCDLPSARWSVACAAEYPEVYAAVAIHPNSTLTPWGTVLQQGGLPPPIPPGPPYPPAQTPAEVLAALEDLAASPKVVAIGETGLDYYRDWSPRQVQRDWFRAHIEIAKRTGKALMIHDREAHDDVLAILAEFAPWPPYSVILHCFSGDAEMAGRCAEAGYVMSFAGNVTFKNAQPLRSAAEAAPPELILAETDAPYLTPVPHRGKPNSPAMTAYTIRFLAELKNLDLAEFCAQLQSTGARVFAW